MQASKGSCQAFSVGLLTVIFLSACATTEDIQGPSLFAEVAPLDTSPYYQGGPVSLPAVRQVAQAQAQVLLDVSNRESRIRSGAGTIALGSGLTALGLSITDEGTPDFYTFLGLAGATAVSGSQYYVNRQRQLFIDRSARTLNCMISTTDPYYISAIRARYLFGTPDAAGQREKLREAFLARGYDLEVANQRASEAVIEGGLIGDIQSSIEAAELVVIQAKFNARVLRDKNTLPEPELQQLDSAITALTTATAEANVRASDLAKYRAELDMAGAQLANAMRDLILYMTEEIRKAEPDVSQAQAALGAIKSGLAGTLASFDGADFRATIAGLGATAAEAEAALKESKDDSALEKDRELKNNTLSVIEQVLAKLNAQSRFTSNELAIVNEHKNATKRIAGCVYPASADTIIVAPSGLSHTIAAGATQTLTITVGPDTTPNVAISSETADVLTKGNPQQVSGSQTLYTVLLTANTKVAKATVPEVTITSPKTDNAVRKVFTVKASPTPTISVSPAKGSVSLEKGGSPASLTITVSDGSAPRVVDAAAGKTTVLKTGPVTKVTGTDNEFTVDVSADSGASGSEGTLVITAGTPGGKVDYNIELKDAPVKQEPKQNEEQLPTTAAALTAGENEKVTDFVRYVQTFLNKNHGASITVSGQMDQATRVALKKMPAQTVSELGLENGVITKPAIVYFAKAIIAENETKIQAEWKQNQPRSAEALRELISVLSNQTNVKVDSELDQNEKLAVWNYQYSVHDKEPESVGTIDLTGALDAATINKILTAK